MLEVLESASPQALRQARQNYADCMAKFLGQPPNGRILIDKNPSLTGLVLGFTRVFPEAKILVALRDPRDVCLSCFMQPLPLGQASSIFLTLEDTAQEYASIMGLWKAVAPCLGNAFLELRYEDLVADLEGVSRRALDFLGAAWDPRVLRFDEHARSIWCARPHTPPWPSPFPGAPSDAGGTIRNISNPAWRRSPHSSEPSVTNSAKKGAGISPGSPCVMCGKRLLLRPIEGSV